MLNLTKTYHRKKQILYDESGSEILRFKDKMPDGENFTGPLIENMNNYIRIYPERVEVIESKKETNVQINLF